MNERLTKKYKESINACINKLSQLEELENELDIELLILFKALSQGIYIKNNYEGLGEDKIMFVESEDIKLCFNQYSDSKTGELIVAFEMDLPNHFQKDIYNIKDYGKTWDLTKNYKMLREKNE